MPAGARGACARRSTKAMPKRLRVLFCVLALLLGGGLAAVLLTPSSPVNRANYLRIQPGMPKGEVEQVLGGPAMHYAPGAQGYWERLPLPPEFTLRPELEQELESGLWHGDEATIVVCF